MRKGGLAAQNEALPNPAAKIVLVRGQSGEPGSWSGDWCVCPQGGHGVDFKPSSRGRGSLGSSLNRDDGNIHKVADPGPMESGHSVSTHSLLLSFGRSSGLISLCDKTLAS